jgi:hypothetical protein
VGYFLVILLRAALPRIRIDHMLDLNWKFLVPVSLAAIVLTLLGDKLIQTAGIESQWLRAGLLFLGNVLLVWLTYAILSGTARRMRAEEEGEADDHGNAEAHAAVPGEAGAHAAPAH